MILSGTAKKILLVGVLILVFVGLVFLIYSSRDNFKNSYNTNVWQTYTGKKVLFPEKCMPRFQNDNLKGLAYSGGGSRSYSSMIGYIRALNRMGLYNKIDYVSTVSGGSWFHGTYSYANAKGISIDTLLGKSLNVPTMTLKDLDKENFIVPVEKNLFLGARVNNAPVIKLLMKALVPVHGIPLNQIWNHIIGKILLEPYALNDNVPCTMNEEMAKQINTDNKTNLNILKLKDTDPFWICCSTLGCTEYSCPYLVTEFTPMYSGIVKEYKLPDGSIIGGYVVENYAFGSDSPNSSLTYNSIVEKVCETSPFKVIVNNLGKRCFTLRDMLGCSSAAYAGFVLKYPLITATDLVPKYLLWYKNTFKPTISDVQCSFNISKNKCIASKGYDNDTCQLYYGSCYSNTALQCENNTDCSKGILKCNNNKNGSSLYCRRKGLRDCICLTQNRIKPNIKEIKTRFANFLDGGSSDNLGVLSLVRRGVNKIISFCNTYMRLFNDSAQKPCYTDISLLFGIGDYCDETLFKLAGDSIKIFDKKDYELVYEDLKKSFLSGGPTFSRRKIKTIANELYEIEAGFEVDVLFIVNQPSTKFLDSLEPSLRDAIKNDFLNFRFSNFPNYRTAFASPLLRVIELTKIQINLLSTYTDWCISQPEVEKHVKELLN